MRRSKNWSVNDKTWKKSFNRHWKDWCWIVFHYQTLMVSWQEKWYTNNALSKVWIFNGDCSTSNWDCIFKSHLVIHIMEGIHWNKSSTRFLILFYFSYLSERLREISMQGVGNTTQLLSRENRILERKVRVCKSHLELVSCLEAANKQKTPPPQQQKKRSSYHKLSAKLKAKLLNKSPPTTPSRKTYKVTSV